MATVQFNNISDLKKTPTVKKSSGLGGFPQPMQAQMKPPRRKVKFPTPERKK